MKKIKKISNKLPVELMDLIFEFSDIKCKTCLKKLNTVNSCDFFTLPRNNKHGKLYCSTTCYNHI